MDVKEAKWKVDLFDEEKPILVLKSNIHEVI